MRALVHTLSVALRSDASRLVVEINGRRCYPVVEAARRIMKHPATVERRLRDHVVRVTPPDGGRTRVYVDADAVDEERRRILESYGVGQENTAPFQDSSGFADFAATRVLELEDMVRTLTTARRLEREAYELERRAASKRSDLSALYERFIDDLIPARPMND